MTTVMQTDRWSRSRRGDEGFVGVNAMFGDGVTSGEAMMQVPDTNAEVMSVDFFRREMDRRGPFFDCIQRYAQGFLSLMMQSTACMARHPVQERCCRWLLMTHDRVRSDQFHLSHEFLAMMLRRAHRRGRGRRCRGRVIKYVTADHDPRQAEAEAASCEC